MSADAHLFVFDTVKVSPEIVRAYLAPLSLPDPADEAGAMAFVDESARQEELRERIFPAWNDPDRDAKNPIIDDCWLGQVSWAKAGDTAEIQKWVPRMVQAVHEIYARQGNVIQVTPGLVAQVTLTFNLPHTSHYEISRNEGTPRFPIWSKSRGINDARTVKQFLTRYMGAYTFLDSM